MSDASTDATNDDFGDYLSDASTDDLSDDSLYGLSDAERSAAKSTSHSDHLDHADLTKRTGRGTSGCLDGFADRLLQRHVDRLSHFLCRALPQHAYSLYWLEVLQQHCTVTIHSLYCHYSLTILLLFTHCTVTIHSLYCHYSLTVLSLFTHCTVTIHSLYCHYSLTVLSLLSFRRCV